MIDRLDSKLIAARTPRVAALSSANAMSAYSGLPQNTAGFSSALPKQQRRAHRSKATDSFPSAHLLIAYAVSASITANPKGPNISGLNTAYTNTPVETLNPNPVPIYIAPALLSPAASARFAAANACAVSNIPAIALIIAPNLISETPVPAAPAAPGIDLSTSPISSICPPVTPIANPATPAWPHEPWAQSPPPLFPDSWLGCRIVSTALQSQAVLPNFPPHPASR
ncbi:hypothetical protein GLGCALEP_03064 [Pseudomonas sp. MM221]|nr:hypothetical protein GLGCALEP_03064 [Pseudomonas sp. MM221]